MNILITLKKKNDPAPGVIAVDVDDIETFRMIDNDAKPPLQLIVSQDGLREMFYNSVAAIEAEALSREYLEKEVPDENPDVSAGLDLEKKSMN